MSQQQQQPQQQRSQQGPTRPPQPRHPAGGAAAGSDPSMTPRKRANEQVDLERPNKQQDARDGQQQQQQGGGRGGFRGGMRGGRGGGRPQQPQQQQQQLQFIPHPNQQQQPQQQQQQQQRPQSAQQPRQQQQQQQNGGGGRNNNRGPRPNRVDLQAPAQQQDATMEDASPFAGASSSSSAPVTYSTARPTVESSFKTDDTFAALGLSAPTFRALREDFKYETMSIVQSKTIPIALTGRDLVAKAKTGTGKTLAFLIPLCERVLAKKQSLPQATGPRPVRALVISPTRELAQQIEEEAVRLGKFHSIRICCVVGGLAINKDLRALQQGNGLDVLIATPGRLKDLLQNYDGIHAALRDLCFLVLDEADRLLDMGFKPDLDVIFSFLPPAQKRQTLLFSATFPANVAEMTARTLKKEHEVVSCVGDEDDNTHQHVMQESVIVPLAQQYHALYDIISAHKAACPHYKVIVFFTTARVASFSSRLFNQADCPTLELHSRLSQPKRTKTIDQFRAGSRMILFSSDVSARGLDVEGVTLVIQLGLTAKDQYVHRLGRTARAGKEGHGVIILAPFERRFLQTLTAELPIKPIALQQGSVLQQLTEGKTPAYPAAMRKGNHAHPLDYALSLVENESSGRNNQNDEESLKGEAESAYRAWMGFYNGNLRVCGWNKEQLVSVANEFSAHIGLAEVPFIESKTVGKMGLKGTPGLRISPNMPRQQNGGGGGGRGGQGGGRGGGQGGRGGGRPQSARY